MKLARFLSSLSIIFLLIGCSNNRLKENSDTINIDIENFADVNEFFDDSRFVILETNDSARQSDSRILRG